MTAHVARQRRPVAGALAALAALLGACSGVSVQHREAPELAALRQHGVRVAVMPFSSSAPEDGFLSSSLAPVGQLLALEAGAQSLPPRLQIGAVLRRNVVAWLSQGNFEVVEPWVSDTQLVHAGWSVQRLVDRGSAAAAATVLGVDAVLYGDVVRWNRSYYVVQSVAEVGLQVELLDAGGKSLFWSEHIETIGSGITGGPTGIGAAATSPVAGLRSSNLQELTRSVARSVAADLNGGTLDGDPASGANAPRLAFVALAAPHPGPFRSGDRIEVIAAGTPGCDVRFDLGRLRVGVPLVQQSVVQDPRGDRAFYQGHYVLQGGELEGELPLYGTIRRQQQKRAMLSRYRWDGTVALAAAH